MSESITTRFSEHKPVQAEAYILATLRAEKRARILQRIGKYIRDTPRPHLGSKGWKALILEQTDQLDVQFIQEDIAEHLAHVAAIAIEAMEQYTA